MNQNDEHYSKIKENENLYKLEYSSFKRNQKLSDAFDSHFAAVNAPPYISSRMDLYFFVLSLLLFIVVFVVESILLPLIFDNTIPLNGYYFLIGWIPFALFSLFFLVNFIIACYMAQFIPFFTESQCLGPSNGNGNSSLYFPYLLLFVPFAIFGIGVKLIAFRNDNYWTYCMLPTVFMLIFTYINTIPFIFRIFERDLRGRQLVGMVWSMLSLYTCFASIALGISFCCLNLDGFIRLSWSVAFIPFYIPILVASLFPLMFPLFTCDLLYLYGSFCLFWFGIIFSSPFWLTIMLAGLKLDGSIAASFVHCFIPIYIMEGFIVLSLCFIAVPYLMCCK
jgi:hypothetical protein